MRHSPMFARSLFLAGLLTALLSFPSPTYATIDPVGAFYARMLREHDGVFVEEELAGLLDREKTADALRSLLDEYHSDVRLVVIAGRGEYFAAQDLAEAVYLHSARPIMVLSMDSLHIGGVDIARAGIPESAAEYAGLTGGWYEYPEDKLERVLRMAGHPDLEELAKQAANEVEARADVVSEETDNGSATLHRREYAWVSWAGGALGAALAYATVISALRWYRFRPRPGTGEER